MALVPPPHARAARGLLVALGLASALALVAGGPSPSPGAEEGARAAARVQDGAAHAWLVELQGRYPGRWRGSAAHGDAPAFIASALAAAGAVDVRVETPRTAAGEARNVLGRVPGRDASRCVVLAAHHDVVVGAPGAIDDGGAVAAILEAVRALVAGPPPACDVEVAVYDYEENGLLGSKAHVRALGEAGRARVRAALAVELVGWERDRLVLQTIPWGFATRAEGVVPAWVPETVRVAAEDARVPVGLGDPRVAPWYQATVRVLGLQTGSDADAFLAAGVPACLLTGSSLTNFYAHYHQETDDLPQVDPARLDDAARAIAAAAHALAAQDDEVAARRALGDVYLMVGLRTLGRGALTTLGLLLAAALAVTATGLGAGTSRAAGALTGVLAGALAVAALLPSLFALSILAPLALGAIAAALTGRVRLSLYPAKLVAAAEPLLVTAGAASFGFRWQGSTLETAAAVVGAVAALGLGPALVRPRAPAPPPP